jgi:hypothetical protein
MASAMSEQIEKLLAEVSRDTFEKVARGVLDDPSAKLVGTPEWQPIGGVHNDWQTVAVLMCVGRADSGGSEKPWSAVFKYIDLSVAVNPHALGMDPRNEIALYRDGLLADSTMPFRAAKCFLIDQHDSDHFSLWLEDLSTAVQPPWSVEQYKMASGCIGQFQGKHISEGTQLPYVADNDVFKSRWAGWAFDQALKVYREQRNHPDFKRAFSGKRLDLVIELIQSFPVLLERVGQVERVLSHGDCHARNLFLTDDALVGIDWAGISYEPLGSDFGQMAGAGFSWLDDERIAVAEAFPDLFNAYVQGMSKSGWDGDESTLRLGMAGQFTGYLVIASSLPALTIADVDVDGNMAMNIEKRMGIPIDEIPANTSSFLDITEPFIHEAIELANGK